MKPVEEVSVQHYPSRTIENIQTDHWDLEYKPGFRKQAEEAVKALRNEKHNLISLEEGIETMKLISQIYEQ